MSVISPPSSPDETIGAAIRSARLKRRISPDTLAAGLGVCRQQIRNYETGKQRIKFARLARIAALLRCDVSELLHGIEPPGDRPVMSREAAFLATAGELLLEAFSCSGSDEVRGSLAIAVNVLAEASAGLEMSRESANGGSVL